LTRVFKGLLEPSRTVAHVRGKFDNFGDILVSDAIAAMYSPLHLVDCGRSRKTSWLDSLVGLRRFFRYSCLGGGTLVLAPTWLPSVEFVTARTTPLFTMGTGVIDPEFVRGLLGDAVISESCVEGWIECLERFRWVSVRGVESQRVLAECGFHRAEVVGDPALYYAWERVLPKAGNRRIGVNVSNYSYFWGNSQDATTRTLTDLIAWLDREGWKVTIFPSMPEDRVLSRSILGTIDSERIGIVDYSDREALLDELAAQDLFVGVKLHTVIAACCVHTPAIMIGYQPKCLDFMRTMGLESNYIRADHLNLDDLVGRIGRVCDDLESVQRRQSEAVQFFRGRLLGFRNQVLHHLGTEPSPGIQAARVDIEECLR
jgi:hypothetical protein